MNFATCNLPITSFRMFAHGGNFKSGRQMHSSVFFLLLIRTAEKTGYGSGLSGLPIAVHQSHSLPVKVVLAFHREQSMDSPRRLLTRFLAPPIANAQTQQQYDQQNREFRHCSSIQGQTPNGHGLKDLKIIALMDI